MRSPDCRSCARAFTLFGALCACCRAPGEGVGGLCHHTPVVSGCRPCPRTRALFSFVRPDTAGTWGRGCEGLDWMRLCALACGCVAGLRRCVRCSRLSQTLGFTLGNLRLGSGGTDCRGARGLPTQLRGKATGALATRHAGVTGRNESETKCVIMLLIKIIPIYLNYLII